jgi:hypothetical protein
MMLRKFSSSVMAIAPFIASTNAALAQRGDVWLSHDAATDKIAVGAVDESGATLTPGVRVFEAILTPDSSVNDPGFNAIGATTGTVPPGFDALPGDADLFWDFLPMKIGEVTSSLMYWNGAGTTPTDVSFGMAPSDEYSLSLFGQDNLRAAADGSDQLVPGHIVDTTASDGLIHVHRFFFLDNDHDDDNATVAAEGVYLISMRLRVAGLDRSDPFYIVWSSPGATTAALQAAASWVDDRVDQLAPNFDADLDGDLEVDGADFLAWQRGLSLQSEVLQIDGDADRDRAVTAADLAVWREQAGLSVAIFPGASSRIFAAPVPEPGGWVTGAAALAMIRGGRRHRAERGREALPTPSPWRRPGFATGDLIASAVAFLCPY